MTFPRVVFVLCASLILCSIPVTITADPIDTMLSEDADLSEIYEDIAPVDLAQATVDDLAALPVFTLERASAVIAYRDSIGQNTISVASIPALTGLERAVLSEAARLGERHRPVQKFNGSFRSGYRYRPIDETPQEARYYIRGQFGLGERISATVLGSRDPAEPRAFDAYSANIALRMNQDRVRLVLGDYRPSFGQRLVYSRYARTMVSGGGAYAVAPGTIASTSFEETRFLRGMFLRVNTGLLTTDTWVSQRALDATLDTNGQAVTIRESGIHTADSPRENLTERLAGASVTFADQGRWQFGILGTAVSYDPTLAQGDGEQNLNDPSGDQFGYISVAGEFRIEDTRFYAEHAREWGGEHASAAGIEMTSDRFRSVLAVRDASAGYWSLRSAGINSFGSSSNEEGIYSGFDARFPGSGTLSASYDIARTKTRTATVPFSRARRRLNARVTFPLAERWELAVAARSTDDLDTGTVRRVQKLTVEQVFSSRRSVEYTAARTSGEGTAGTYAESILRLDGGLLRGVLGISGFRIPSYDARYYRYEPDVPGNGMMRPVWGTGCSLLLQVRVAVWSARYRLVAAENRIPAHELAVQADIRW